MDNQRISIIGSGNVATQLALKLFQAGHQINQIYSRTFSNSQNLASKVKSQAIANIHQMDPNTDVVLISVSDKAISEILDQINFSPKLIAHTAGSIPMEILNKFPNYGVFYPFQTITKNSEIKTEIPFCIEANTIKNTTTLINLAKTISNKVMKLSTGQRKQCHLAAVFACNFTNHFYAIAQDILQQENISFDIIKPLILETAQKVQNLSPTLTQTGPASRNDQLIMNEHINQLSSPHLEKLYSFVSESIIELKKQTEKKS